MRFNKGGGYVSMSALGRILLDPQAGEMQGGTLTEQRDDTNEGTEDKGESKGAESEGEGDSKPDPTAEELREAREAIAALKRDLETYKSKVNESETAEQKRQREAREAEKQAEIEKHRKSGDFDKIEARYKNEIEEFNKKLQAAEDAVKVERNKMASTVLEMQLTTEFSKHRIAEGWLPNLIALHKSEFEAIDRGDKFEVQSKDARSLASKVKEILNKPEYKRILLAENGGKGGGSTQRQEPPRSDSDDTGEIKSSEDMNRRLIKGYGASRMTGTLGAPSAFQFGSGNGNN